MTPELPPFDRARVLVVGDIMLDRYWEGDAARVSPEAPVPVVSVRRTRDRPGGAGNVALNVAALGAGARLVGPVGDDAAAATLEAMLRAAGVACDLSRVPGASTIVKLRVISRHQQLLRVDFEQDIPLVSTPLQPAARRLADCTALVLSDYAKGALAEPAGLIAAARARGIPVLVDPKGTDFGRYRGASVLTPNRQELEAVVGPCAGEAELLAAGSRLLAALDLGALLVTRGDQGMTLLRPDAEVLHLPARAREVFDVTGAGDTVIGVLAAALAAGTDLPRAVTLANIAAGMVVAQLGAAAVSAPQLQRALAADRGAERGVLGLAQLQGAVAEARARGEKLVFTNGCFDIIHAGHVACLEQARRLGDRLVVAVNSDRSVSRLKGSGRPINPLARRMAVLAGLEAVDWVVSFDDDTPLELLRALRPDILVKGGDYRRKEDVVGWEVVEAYGGRVELTGEVDGLSTSALVARLQIES